MKQLIFISAFAFAFVSCKRESAYWSSNWNVPLVEDSLTLEDLVPDTILTTDNGHYALNLNQLLYEFRLSDFVEIPDTTIRNSFSMGLNINVPPNTSFVNNIEEHHLDVGDAQLKEIRVKEGGITVRVYNPIGTKTQFTVQLPGVTKNGVMLSQSFTAPAGSQANPGMVSSFVNLAGYKADLTGINGLNFNTIQSKMIVKSDPNGPTVTVTTQDTVFFDATLQGIKLDYARGYFGNIMQADMRTTSIQALSKIAEGDINVDAWDLDFIIENGFKVNGKYKINSVTNQNKQGSEIALIHPILGVWNTINQATGTNGNITPTVNTIQFTGANSNLEQFIENHGELMTFDYSINLNPWGNTSGGWDEIYDAYPLKVKMAGTIPLNVGLNNLVVMDTFNLKINQDQQATHVKSGMFLLEYANAFPMQGELELLLMNSSYQTLATLTASDLLKSGATGSIINGMEVATGTIEIPITESTVNVLDQVKYCVLRVKLNSINSSNVNAQVLIPEYAYIKFDLKTKFILETHI